MTLQAPTASTTQLNYYNNVNFSRKNNKLHNLNVIFQQAAMGMNEPFQAAVGIKLEHRINSQKSSNQVNVHHF